MKQPFRHALCGALLCALPVFAPSSSHAETGVNDQIAQAMDEDYKEMAKDVLQEKQDLSRKTSDPDAFNPTDKRQEFVKKNMGLAANQKPESDAQQHNKDVKEAGKKANAYEFLPPNSNVVVDNNRSGNSFAENTNSEDASCKIATASPDAPSAQKTTILASPIAATLLALPIQAAAGGSVCPPNSKTYCKDGHYTKKEKSGKTADALPKSPINDSIQALQGTKHVPEN